MSNGESKAVCPPNPSVQPYTGFQEACAKVAVSLGMPGASEAPSPLAIACWVQELERRWRSEERKVVLAAAERICREQDDEHTRFGRVQKAAVAEQCADEIASFAATFEARRCGEASPVVDSRFSETSRNTRDGETPPTSQAATKASTSAPGTSPGGPGGPETTGLSTCDRLYGDCRCGVTHVDDHPGRESPSVDIYDAAKSASEALAVAMRHAFEDGLRVGHDDSKALAGAVGELIKANDDSLGWDRPRPDIAWRNVKEAFEATQHKGEGDSK